MSQQRTHHLFSQLIPILVMFLLSTACVAGRAQLTPPPGYLPIAEVDLSRQPHDEAVVGEFSLDERAEVGIFYTLPDTDTSTFNLSLLGPGAERWTILHSEGYRTDETGGGSWEQELESGTYRLALTATQAPGILTVYWGRR